MRSKLFFIATLALAPAAPLSSQRPAAKPESVVDFYSQVEPIFNARCYGCHSESLSESNLRLDTKAAALKGGDSGAVILSGNSRDSILMHRVVGLNGLRRMPASGAVLTTDEIDILRRWIDQGANWPDTLRSASTAPKHWAYVKPVRPALPAV